MFQDKDWLWKGISFWVKPKMGIKPLIWAA